MTSKPGYFEAIRKESADRWEQLESDPVLAGPWWQLFKQVQSPRHIVSELLQNADDAGATEAIIRIDDGFFLFEHNGKDFTEEHFRSLCRFGYSNKRALHTIGFRGIGFKSTFSLGNPVELITPTLDVAFHQDRFTEPKWNNGHGRQRESTVVRVAIGDSHRRKELEKNLDEWLESPVSLLFFNNIRRIRIADNELHWRSLGFGPVDGTEWLALHDNEDEKFLIARSEPERFPEDALNEIREERMLFDDEETDFPPCAVEIVLGARGRLYVVLPTGVKTSLPFACNAPFIQDPARLKIKDPETSPTNRWLLNRAGQLAAEVMLRWLSNDALDQGERARAYALMPDVDRADTTLEGTCSTIVEEAFESRIEDKDVLLTENGKIVEAKKSIVLPRPVFDVWPDDQAMAMFDEENRPALSHQILDADRAKLLSWGLVEELDDDDVLASLRTKHFPKPKTWAHLLHLWAYIGPLVSDYRYHFRKEALRIVPVQGKDVLYASEEVVRLGEKKLVPTEEDWKFLGNKLLVLNQNWLRYLAERRRLAEQEANDSLAEMVEAAHSALTAIGLGQPSDTGNVIDRVAADFFSADKVSLDDSIRIAQIAAKLGATIGMSFRFVCEDKRFRGISKTVLIDTDGTLSLILPEDWCEEHLLHPKYLKSFASCTREEWQQWISSGRSGLNTFVPLSQTQPNYMPQRDLEPELTRRGYSGPFEPRYKSPWFQLRDWDFDPKVWKHWNKLAKEDPEIWATVTAGILTQSEGYWTSSLTATVMEQAQNGNTRNLIRNDLAPAWILKLRNKKCLRDTHGRLWKPGELLRRTPETEALRDIEAFVDARLDNSTTAPLLDLLGVGNAPTSPEKLIKRIQTLSKAKEVPPHEIEKWYRRLDELIDNCSTDDFVSIKSLFRTERLILTENAIWETTSGVFIYANEEDAPGAEVIRASVRDLSLWRKIGIEERPSPELAISWLESLPPGSLSTSDLRRVRALLQQYPRRVWQECGHWLSLAGKWTPVKDLEFALTLHPLVPWSHLHQWVKEKTANLQNLSVDISSSAPFADIPLLATHVEERVHRHGYVAEATEVQEWVKQLGIELQRLNLKDEEEAARTRALAKELTETKWSSTRELEIISYIDGKPAGTPRPVDAMWCEGVLYAADKPFAKLARSVSLELGRQFQNTEITDAIKLCFDRTPEFVTEYMEGNFTLLPREEARAFDSGTLPQVGEQTDEAETESGEKTTALGSDESQNLMDADDQGMSSATEDPVIDVDDLGADGEPSPEDEEWASDNAAESTSNTQSRKRVPQKPSVIERFALSRGFRKDSDTRFYDEAGNWIAKVSGSLFPWELRTASGDIARRYWPKDHCLEKQPLQIDAEVWSIIEKSPDEYVLLLFDLAGLPLEITGEDLREMQENGELTLHPSTYRLVIEHDQVV